MNALILAHGGTESKPEEHDGCEAAVRRGMDVMHDGALAAVVAAVSVLEADGRYNAGRGSLLCLDGKTMSCDASVMDSRGKLGAVANLVDVLHPVRVARRVADTPHHLLVGVGALEFAKRLGLHAPFEPTPKAKQQYREVLKAVQNTKAAPSADVPDSDSDEGRATLRQFWNFPGDWQQAADRSAHCTVGAVARHPDGGFAAAVSTGGSMPALLGRVGDSPLVGCGFYAGDAGAVACTGIGEHILRHNLALRVYLELERGTPLRQALREGMDRIPPEVEVAMIGVTRDDDALVTRNPMAWARAER